MNSPSKVTVAVPVPLRRLFDYVVPQTMASAAVPGMRVRVPFGGREAIGVIVSMADVPMETAAAEVSFDSKPLTAVLDAEPLIPAELLDLCRWAADYYRHPLGEVLSAALPGPLRRGAPAIAGQIAAVGLTPAGAAARAGLSARAAGSARLIDALLDGPRSRATLAADGISAASLRRAFDHGWIEPVLLLPDRLPPPLPRGRLPALTAQQAAALEPLRAGVGGTTLLQGVTGSGKTELYLRLAADALAAGRQVLVLTPEIGLTPQLAERFVERFGECVASFHSGLSEAERSRVWLGARDGRVRVIVGTRSAVLVPLLQPGLIIVDEEHDGSYKQQDGFRYSARDLAVLRAQRLGIAAVLGSATPSLESLHNVAEGRYRRVVLTRRISDQTPPRINVIDVRHRPLDHELAAPTIEAVERHLAAGGQALLFLNRRGYAPVLLCRDCGWVAPCPDCDARLVLHRGRNRLACHHCGHIEPIPRQCPDCGGRELAPVGAGTERIEDALRLRFPDHRVERFDSDRLRKAGELQRLLDDAQRGDIRILVGTQVLAKGHDFPQLTLAALVDVDQALYGSDFRAMERMGQLVTQVAGRAGRRDQPGEVLLQTHQPEHPLLRVLLENGYEAFAEALLAERRSFGLPPFGHLALLRAEARNEDAAQRYLKEVRALLPAVRGVEILGPAAATMARRAGHHRAQLLLKSATRSALQRLLAAALPIIESLPASRRTRWSIDVDPGDLF